MPVKAQCLILLSLLILVAGCSGLSRTECATFDWEQAGREDGEGGKEISHAETYQKSCAKHNLNADMDAYREGYAEGVRVFCQPENGFELGQQGSQYSGVCPSALAGAFLREYGIGLEFYFVYRDINELENAISRNTNTIDKLNRGISNATIEQDNPSLTIHERFQIRQSIHSMEDQILEYERQLVQLRSLLPQKLQELGNLKDIYPR